VQALNESSVDETILTNATYSTTTERNKNVTTTTSASSSQTNREIETATNDANETTFEIESTTGTSSSETSVSQNVVSSIQERITRMSVNLSQTKDTTYASTNPGKL